MSIEDAHVNPAKPDDPPGPTAIVLTKVRVVRQGVMTYHVPAGSVIAVMDLPAITTFNPGRDAKLIPAGDYRVGDIVVDA